MKGILGALLPFFPLLPPFLILLGTRMPHLTGLNENYEEIRTGEVATDIA